MEFKSFSFPKFAALHIIGSFFHIYFLVNIR